MAATIRLRRDTAANWTSANPVLAIGELGIETNTRKHKIGDGVTAWNSLLYGSAAAAFTDLTDVPSSYTGQGGKLVAVKGSEDGLEFGGSTVHAGKATLATGTVTVPATWVTADSVVTVTACTSPGTAGTNLSVDPANHDPGVSFQIDSDDATDARDVFWIATEPDEFNLFLEFTVNVHTRSAAGNGDFLQIGDGASNYIGIVGTGTTPNRVMSFYSNVSPFNGVDSANGTFEAFDTDFTVKMKIRWKGSSVTVYPTFDGVALTSFTADGLNFPTEIDFGGRGGFAGSHDYTLDNLKVGTTLGGTEIFSADFAGLSVVPPFDSTTLSGDGALDASGGNLDVTYSTTSDAYAVKAITFP